MQLFEQSLYAHVRIVFQHLQVEIAKLTLQIEEVLLWKMYQFFGYSTSDLEIEKIDESNFDSQK